MTFVLVWKQTEIKVIKEAKKIYENYGIGESHSILCSLYFHFGFPALPD